MLYVPCIILLEVYYSMSLLFIMTSKLGFRGLKYKIMEYKPK